MKTIKNSIFAASLIISGLGTVFGGQALFAPVKDFYDGASLVVIVDVKKVTRVEISTGGDQTSDVYVAEAAVLQTLKSDHTPPPQERTIAVVASTIPMSSAVWRPIEKKRYLAFLNPEQGHYRFGERYAMRPISADGKVEWIEKNSKGDYELSSIDIEEAIKRIKESEQGGDSDAE